MGMGWRSQHELIMCGTRENAMWSKYMGPQGNVITLKRDPNLEHPTMKPVALLDTVLETTPFAETVYDPFVGSGTTIIAAERQGRACWAMLGPHNITTALEFAARHPKARIWFDMERNVRDQDYRLDLDRVREVCRLALGPQRS